ncbi:MAG: hypothetical protein LBF97_00410, partial [Elusimicrobiota bacterium]|nr:hypothetical protein [Elusimicrobiota bacterium]
MSKITKNISIITLISFFMTGLNNFSYANFIPNTNVETLNIPIKYGKITENFEGDSYEKIYLIQDLHCNTEVQKNIFKILDEIKKAHKNDFNIIGLEGTPVSEVKTDIISKIKNKKIKENIIRYYVKEGMINAAELYSIVNPKKIKLIGIEKKNLYLENFDKLYKSLLFEYEIEEILFKLEKNYERTKKYFFTKEIEKLETIKKKYESGKLNFEDYIEHLKDEAKNKKISFEYEFKNLEKILAIRKKREEIEKEGYIIEKKAKIMLEKLGGYLEKKEIEKLKFYKNEEYYFYLDKILKQNKIDINQNYKEIVEYIKYLKEIKSLDELMLIEEKNILELKLYEYFIKERGDGYKFFYNYNNIKILRKYLRNELSIKGVEYYQNNEKILEELKEFSEKLLGKNYFEIKDEIIKKAEMNMKQFYTAAEKRNEIMINNLLSEGFGKSKIMAIILGGYHSEGVKNYLRSKGISYEEIIPEMKIIAKKNKYKERLLEQAKIFNRYDNIIDLEKVKNDKLQLISIFANENLFSGKIDIEQYLLNNKILDANATIKLINEKMQLPIEEITELDTFNLTIQIAINYEEIVKNINFIRNFKKTKLGEKIFGVLEAVHIKPKTIKEDSTKKSDENKILGRQDLSDFEKEILSKAIEFENNTEILLKNEQSIETKQWNIYSAVSLIGGVAILNLADILETSGNVNKNSELMLSEALKGSRPIPKNIKSKAEKRLIKEYEGITSEISKIKKYNKLVIIRKLQNSEKYCSFLRLDFGGVELVFYSKKDVEFCEKLGEEERQEYFNFLKIWETSLAKNENHKLYKKIPKNLKKIQNQMNKIENNFGKHVEYIPIKKEVYSKNTEIEQNITLTLQTARKYWINKLLSDEEKIYLQVQENQTEYEVGNNQKNNKKLDEKKM